MLLKSAAVAAETKFIHQVLAQMAGDFYLNLLLSMCQCCVLVLCFSVSLFVFLCIVKFSVFFFLSVVRFSVLCVSQCSVFLSVVYFSALCASQCSVFLRVVCFSVPCYGWRLIKCGSGVQMVSRLTGRYRCQCHSRQPCPHSAGLSILPSTPHYSSLYNCCSSVTALTPFASQRGAVSQCLLPPRSQLLCGEPTQRGSPARPASCPAGSW